MACSVGEIRLIADGTKVGFKHRLLIVAIAYCRRAIPIACPVEYFIPQGLDLGQK